MNDYRLGFMQTIDVQNIPSNIQCNGKEINPRLRQFILAGKPCEYDENIRQALKKFTEGNRIKYTVFTIEAILIFLGVLSGFIQKSAGTVTVSYILSAVFLAVILIVIIVFILELYFGSIALRYADAGKVKCFEYDLYGRIRYELDHYEKDYIYYANLGDFCVEISQNADLAVTVTGVVVEMKETEYFYLLVENSGLL